MTTKHVISLEGNIGAGKSTLLNLIKKHYKNEFDFIDEPVTEWESLKNNNKNLIEHFYENPERWSYTFQLIALRTRIQALEQSFNKNNDKEYIFMERSSLTDRYCFAENLYKTGKLNDIEWADYKQSFTWLVSSFNACPDYIIYLRTEPKLCNLRIKSRNRDGESNIPMEYLNDLHDSHESWLNNTDTPVLHLDGSKDFKHDEDILDDFLDSIDEFLRSK